MVEYISVKEMANAILRLNPVTSHRSNQLPILKLNALPDPLPTNFKICIPKVTQPINTRNIYNPVIQNKVTATSTQSTTIIAQLRKYTRAKTLKQTEKKTQTSRFHFQTFLFSNL